MLIRILVSTCLLLFLQSQISAQTQKTIPKEPSSPTLPQFPEKKKGTPPVVDFPPKKDQGPMTRKRATQACLDSCRARFTRRQDYQACRFRCSTQLEKKL